MVDAEVLRLRKLRNVALRARALSRSLDSDSSSGESVFAKGTVVCWTIARIATGRLRAHPYLSYQKGRGHLADLADETIAAAVAMAARRNDRGLRVYARQLAAVAREVDDVRALTWSAELSDGLGRMQVQIRALTKQLDGRLPVKSLAESRPRVNAAVRAETNSPLAGIAVDDSWPYLAI
jgi:hypothetical protein